MQAKRFSSFPQSMQGLLMVNLVSEITSSVFACSVVFSTVISSATDGAGANVSFTLVAALFDDDVLVESDGETSCS
jgi:hypothetical protein